jgi:predicted nucleotidyltransferase component of viral defense system
MRGGTVLHKGHLAPASRYSEDIDLVLITDRKPSHIKRALTRVLQPLLGSPTESLLTNVRLTIRNLAMSSKILRSTYTYDPHDRAGALGKLKVEVNVNETQSVFATTSTTIDVPDSAGGQRPVPVVSYDLDEMLGTKLRALLQREHGRDLFDLWWALEAPKGGSAVKVDPARVGVAFRFYMEQEGSPFSAAKVKAELDRRMTSVKFLKDMDGYLPIGRTYSPEVAYRAFCDVYLPHL